MPGKMAMVTFAKCCPEKCKGGLCAAVQACKMKVLRQEKPGEIPMPNPAVCRGCGDCARACPEKAINVVTQ